MSLLDKAKAGLDAAKDKVTDPEFQAKVKGAAAAAADKARQGATVAGAKAKGATDATRERFRKD